MYNIYPSENQQLNVHILYREIQIKITYHQIFNYHIFRDLNVVISFIHKKAESNNKLYKLYFILFVKILKIYSFRSFIHE